MSAPAIPRTSFLKLARTFVADGLSLLRVLLIVPLVVFALQGNWVLALITLVTAWMTDLADGAAARKWGSLRDIYPKRDYDGIADSLLAFVSSGIPVIYAWNHAPSGVTVILVELYLISLILGSMMAAGMDNLESPRTRKLITINMPIFHGALQIGAVTVWFAYMALGWFGALIAVVVLGIVAVKQLPKIRRWIDGRL